MLLCPGTQPQAPDCPAEARPAPPSTAAPHVPFLGGRPRGWLTQPRALEPSNSSETSTASILQAGPGGSEVTEVQALPLPRGPAH